MARQLSDDVTVSTTDPAPLGEDAVARLISRGIRIVAAPVKRVERAPDGLRTVTTDGDAHEVDAIFARGAPELAIDFATGLGLRHSDAPGAPLNTG